MKKLHDVQKKEIERLQLVVEACRTWRIAEVHHASMVLGIRDGAPTTSRIICDDKLMLLRVAIDNYTRKGR